MNRLKIKDKKSWTNVTKSCQFYCGWAMKPCSSFKSHFTNPTPSHGFDSRTRCHMWVEFVVGSRLCFEGFSPDCPVSLPPQKTKFPNSNSTLNARTPLNEFRELFSASLVNELHFFTLQITLHKTMLKSTSHFITQAHHCKGWVGKGKLSVWLTVICGVPRETS